MKSAICFASVFAVLALLGCGGNDKDGGTTSGPPGPLQRIVVTPVHVSMPVGSERVFAARGEDAEGRTVAIDPVWRVSPINLGRVSVDGLFVANCIPDTGNIVAAVSGKTIPPGTSTVLLTPSNGGPLATLEIEPDTLTVLAGAGLTGSQQFYLIARDASGTPIAVHPAWDVVPSSLGTVVNDYGYFESGAIAGTGSVIATVGDVTATALVHVVLTTGR